MLPKEMKQKRHGSMETVLDCVIPYIHDRDDLNSISLVSRKLYELDGITRKHVTVHAHYAPSPSRVSQRFPFIESLTLKGFPDWDYPQISDSDITPWIEEISVKFECLKALHLRGLYVHNEDLKLLAKTRGKDLRSLKIYKCLGFFEDGLMHVSKYCNDLRTLWLKDNFLEGIYENDGKWLRELALHNKVIESLHFDFDISDVNDLTLIAENFSNSLVSLKISPKKPLNNIGDVFSHSSKLEDFHCTGINEDRDYFSVNFPASIRGLGIEVLHVTSFSFLLPYVNQMRELNLTCNERICCQCSLFRCCPNLEVLCTGDKCRDMGLRVIGQFCKKLRRFTHYKRVTHMGLIALVEGCTNLEYLNVKLADISNEAIVCIGSSLKNLCDIRIKINEQVQVTNLPLDNGIRAMLKGCIKLKRLALSLCVGGLTDVGLGYIGKYGHNLRYLFLDGTRESGAGLLELLKGCLNLRKIDLKNCPFSQQALATFMTNIHSLRHLRVTRGYHTDLALTRPTFTAEVLPELKPYVTLIKKLRRLALQLVADGSGPGSVKITYTSLRAIDDLDTSLVDAMVAKGIRINEERVVLDRASEKPLEIIEVQIANVESRLAVGISESGEIKVEGRVKDGIPYLTKVGVLDVVVSLEKNIILCRHADKPNILRGVSRILDEYDVDISSMSSGRIAHRNQAVMVIGVQGRPWKKVFKKIHEIPDIEEFVFLPL